EYIGDEHQAFQRRHDDRDHKQDLDQLRGNEVRKRQVKQRRKKPCRLLSVDGRYVSGRRRRRRSAHSSWRTTSRTGCRSGGELCTALRTKCHRSAPLKEVLQGPIFVAVQLSLSCCGREAN